MTRPLRVLYVASKPPYPTSDGGRLLMWNTITQLAEQGHRITFVAPDLGQKPRDPADKLAPHCSDVHLVPSRPGRMVPALLRGTLLQRPLSIVRHTHSRVLRRVEKLLSTDAFDLVHAEQVHAVANLPAVNGHPPVVLRAQNVESELWRLVARIRPRAAWIARQEARRMSAYEAAIIDRVAATVALTRHDALGFGGGQDPAARRIRVIPPPFPGTLDSCEDPLEGEPALVVIAGGWLPNRDSLRWFLDAIWGAIRHRNPHARLHIFGGEARRGDSATTWHPSPKDSVGIFHRNAILLVPLRVASGIRMKILEAWARCVPVVATPEATRGLEGTDGSEFLLARNGPEFAEAVRRIHTEPPLRRALVEAGRAVLAARHHPTATVRAIDELYREVTAP